MTPPQRNCLDCLFDTGNDMIEVLKQALEVMEAAIKAGDWKVDGACDPEMAIHSLRQAIAEEEKQEPVAVVQDLDEVKRKHLVYECGFDWKDPLYTHPQPKREPLTDEQIAALKHNGKRYISSQEFARAIEAAHGIKE